MEFSQIIQDAFTTLQQKQSDDTLFPIRQKAYESFQRQGIPTSKHEEWKYTRINGIVNNASASFNFATPVKVAGTENIPALPFTQTALQLVFVDGVFYEELSVLNPLVEACNMQQAADKYPEYIKKHAGHSNHYIKDGMQALNTAFTGNGLFLRIPKNTVLDEPVYIHHITRSVANQVFVQPRILVIVEEHAQVQLVELYTNEGSQECFTNQVTEIAVYEQARMEYYKLQDEAAHCHQVGTTHIQQVGKCFTHCVTITLGGGTVRNNLNLILEAAHNEGHMYGLYLLDGQTHADNHTIVDNMAPDCFSNEFYKGIMDGKSNGVFNGKIFVRQAAQKTNAYQSNKNVLLSDTAQVNTKPQLEIFADDVKCSHGCTIGRLDDEAMFYLKARGIGDKKAKALLLHAFAEEIVEQVKPAELKLYIENLINERLEFGE